jgi:ABC-type transporter Mla maintaining outer membrane lipid asymmetry ATPase subunit MlaF
MSSAERLNLLAPDVKRWPAGEPVIELINVHKRFGELEVLKGVSLSVRAGETFVIAGESGSGKSVLLKMMNGLVQPDQGEVRLFGQPLHALSERAQTALRRRCTMVFQNYALIDSMTVSENIAFPLTQGSGLTPQEITTLVEELLELLELPNTGHLLPASLSGGMKKRVALARAVISNPEVVLFDEPTTGLDPVMIEFVDALIAKTQRLYGITSVLISHDMTSNRRLANRMAILSDGVIATVGTFDEVARAEHPAVKAFMGSAVTERMGRGEEQDSTDHAQSTLTGLEAVARCINLRKSFGEREILKGITLSIPKDKITVIIGGSGSGKSVLVKHIIGLFQPTSGEVHVLGRDLTHAPRDALRETQREVGVLFQGAALFDSMSVRDNIAFPLVEGRKVKRAEALERVQAIAERLSVHELLHRFPDEISNGERKRVGLARALITEPKIMIYDEPTTGQDPIMMRRVDDMIVEAAELFDMTSIVISHDMASTFRIADQIAMIYHGELVACGTPDEVKASADERVQRFIYAGAGS